MMIIFILSNVCRRLKKAYEDFFEEDIRGVYVVFLDLSSNLNVGYCLNRLTCYALWVFSVANV